MQALQNTMEMILTRIRDLSASAKMLVGSLMIILVMTLFLVALYAGRPTMSALPVASLTSETRQSLLAHLEQTNVRHEQQGDRILVPIEQRYAVLAQLRENDLLNADQIDFDAMAREDSPFVSESQSRRKWLVAKQNVLGRMISRFDNIERAAVVLDPAERKGFGQSAKQPSATVTVRSRSNGLSQAEVNTIAATVAGAVAGMEVTQVRIADERTGIQHLAEKPDDLDSSRHLETKLQIEEVTREKIRAALSDIPGVNVEVNAIPDTSYEIARQVSYDDAKLGITESESRSTNSTNTARAAEPGVRPNVGAAIAGASGRESQFSDELTAERAIPFVGETTSQITRPNGHPLKINASIGVPRAYLVAHYKETTGVDEDPDPATLDAHRETHFATLSQYIAPLIDTTAFPGAIAGEISFRMISTTAMADLRNDAPADVAVSPLEWASSGTGGTLIKNIGLGLLALISLAMMFMMVRRASTQEELPTAEELVGIPPALAGADSDLVGEADESSPPLEGVEVSPEKLRSTQMLNQINAMVRERPEEAANVMMRWMRSG